MVKKEDAANTIYADHYTNIIRTLWIGLGLSIIGFILAFIVVGYFLLLGVWIWSVYRIIKGISRITSNKAYSA
jgi:uncharacterized membrane protein